MADSPLRRSSPEPLYRQLSTHLEAEIARGRLKEGDRIDSEDVLAKRFGISRITVRQAIAELVRKHILVRKQGKGTFVTLPVVRHDLRRLHGLAGTLFSQAPDANMKLLRYELGVAPADVADAMGLASGQQALVLERIYLIGAKPVAFARDWLAPEVAAISHAKASLISTEDMMREVGIVVAHAEISIRAEPAGALAARHLKTSARAPMLVLRRQAFAADGRVKESGRHWFCSDRYEFFRSTRDPRAEGQFAIRSMRGGLDEIVATATPARRPGTRRGT
ncbi:MAG: GntR family transcriptional regulator [Rhodospirillaceae bacterium]|nr:GntR family transcriptional regulator [Rhodospirillaceae bacterium]